MSADILLTLLILLIPYQHPADNKPMSGQMREIVKELDADGSGTITFMGANTPTLNPKP